MERTMNTERCHHGQKDDDPEKPLAERFREAFLMENLDALSECLDEIFYLAERKEDNTDAWGALLAQLRSNIEFHKEEMQKLIEREPQAKEMIKQLVIF